MKHQALFSSKDKSKKIKVSSAAILFGALRVKHSVWIKKTLSLNPIALRMAKTQWSFGHSECNRDNTVASFQGH